MLSDALGQHADRNMVVAGKCHAVEIRQHPELVGRQVNRLQRGIIDLGQPPRDPATRARIVVKGRG